MDDGEHEPTTTDPVRGRFEKAISLAAPLFDLVLAVGDRISRVAEPVDYEYYPVRDARDTKDAGDEGDAGTDSNRTSGESDRDPGR
jgi:hypothetical protein